MKHFSILTMIIVLTLFSTSCFSQDSDYVSDYSTASNEGRLWIISISTEFCLPCKLLERDVKALENSNIVFTHITPTSEYGKKLIAIYKSQNMKDSRIPIFRGTPDWAIWKFQDGKFRFIQRQGITGYSGVLPEVVRTWPKE